MGGKCDVGFCQLLSSSLIPDLPSLSSHSTRRMANASSKSPWYYASPALGVAYLQIPKAACSSFQSVLLAAERPELFAAMESELQRSVYSLHHTPGLLPMTSDPEGLLRFTFVRHPFARALSFYLNQVSGDTHLLPVAEQAAISKEVRSFGFTPGMSFTEFVDLIVADGKAARNPHVRRQVEFVFGPKGRNVDYLGEVENLPKHADFLQCRLGIPAARFPRLNGTRGAVAAAHLLAGRNRDALTKYYREDLEAFGYDPQSLGLRDRALAPCST